MTEPLDIKATIAQAIHDRDQAERNHARIAAENMLLQDAVTEKQVLIDKLVEALERARMRVDYLGIQGDERHYQANIKDFLPPIDEALAAVRDGKVV